ncbi:MAG: type II secretion system protein GspN [Deltaproteobacteria bacterium]|nr:type II secretion system protein GspN [Deltaproteobacteria bacterium]
MKKAVLYSLFFLLACGVFLYALFPGKAVKDLLESAVARKAPGVEFMVEKVKPSLPFGLRLTGVRAARRGEKLFEAESVRVAPAIFRFITGGWGFTAKFPSHGGKITLKASGKKRLATEPFSAKIRLDDVEAKDMGVLEHIFGFPFSGSLSADVSFFGPAADWTRGEGEAKLTLSAGKLFFMPEMVGTGGLGVSALTAEFLMQKGEIAFKRFELSGPEAGATLSGSIAIRRPFNESRLNLEGRLTPTPAFFRRLGSRSAAAQFLRTKEGAGGLGFTLSGTAADSQIGFK